VTRESPALLRLIAPSVFWKSRSATGVVFSTMLELRDLKRAFGAVRALDGLSFNVPDGALYGFVGRNGAGKTTAMRIVCRLLEPDAGEAHWDGRPIGRAERMRIGYMPEERGLYQRMAAGDQLAYFAQLHGLGRADALAAARKWLERFGLGDRVQEKVERLSLGNQQRVQLAAALVHEPALLILDEPFSGLDPIVTDVLADVLTERTREGVAVLFSSHQLDLVERLCDGVAIVEAGRTVASGTVAELQRSERRPVLRVEVEGAPLGWTTGLEHVEPIEGGGERTLLALDDGADTQRVLDAARAAGRVRHFAEVRPSLGEIFREVIER